MGRQNMSRGTSRSLFHYLIGCSLMLSQVQGQWVYGGPGEDAEEGQMMPGMLPYRSSVGIPVQTSEPMQERVPWVFFPGVESSIQNKMEEGPQTFFVPKKKSFKKMDGRMRIL